VDSSYRTPAFSSNSAIVQTWPAIPAAIAGAPLVHVFNLRERGGHYHFFGFPVQRPVMPAHEKRDTYLRECAARFAKDLESLVKRDPLQWYNFYPFWQNLQERSKRQPIQTAEINARENAGLETAGTTRHVP
jgi:predicted LPLAT superfamily acyltransferase